MTQMVNKLRLRQTISRKFVNEVDSDEDNEKSGAEDDCLLIDGTDVQIRPNESKNSCKQMNGVLNADNNSLEDMEQRLRNIKIIVSGFGQSVERLVIDLDPKANTFIPIMASDLNLMQAMDCKDLNEMEVLLAKKETKKKRTNGNKPKTKSKNQQKSESISTSNGIESESELDSLQSEGIRKSDSKSDQKYDCFVCDRSFHEIKEAMEHIHCEEHSRKIFGDDLKGLDALFTIDSETIGQVFAAISRKNELKIINANDKQRYLSHGIRLKDGFGDNAYICSNCNISLCSLSEVRKHVNSFDTIVDQTSDKTNDEPIDSLKQIKSEPNVNKMDQKLRNEGIKACDEPTDEFKFYCYFCNIYFDCKKTVVSHTCDPRHRKTKKEENLNEIDSKFTVQSERMDEFEVAFARRQALNRISTKTKIDLTNDGIRLRDGIGINAFICEKCNLSIEREEEIDSHIKSSIHSNT